jgi:hypothetical protein
MNVTRLEDWLRRISEDGDLAAVDAARGLLLTDPRIPDELRHVLDEADDREGAVEALLFLLGEGEPLIAAAVMSEVGAGLDEDLSANPIEGVPVAAALCAELGRVELVDAVLGELEIGIPMVQSAIASMVGRVDVSDAVLGRVVPGDAAMYQPAEVRSALMAAAGVVDVVAVVMQRVGVADPASELASAVRAAAGTLDVADLAQAPWGAAAPVRLAIQSEAGSISIVDAVMSRVGADTLPEGWMSALLDRELADVTHRSAAARIAASPALGRELTSLAAVGPAVRSAVTSEAGVITCWSAVAASVGIADPEQVRGWDGAAVRGAVVDEAGRVDVVRDVMVAVRKSAVAAGDHAAATPANGTYWLAALVAVAATALIVFGFTTGGVLEPPSVAHRGAPALVSSSPLVFARADEIRVEDLNYADNATVQVIQEEGAEAAMIIWVDEGKTL